MALKIPNAPVKVTSITRSGSTATATTGSAHGFTSGETITIIGATQGEYNGSFVITVDNASQFHYTVSGTPATPATTSEEIFASRSVSAHKRQAQPDAVDIDVLSGAFGRTGVIRGFGGELAVTFASSLTFNVASGDVYSRAVRLILNATTVTVGAVDATNPRFDMVVVTSGGSVTVRAGTVAANPVFPALTAGDVALAAIFVPSTASGLSVGAGSIVDKRVLISDLPITGKIGALTIIGHSYAAGVTQGDSGTSNVWQESAVAKLQALLGIHENNTLNIASAGSTLAGGPNVYAGWKGVLQFVLPSNSTVVNDATDIVASDPLVAVGGAAVIIHGCNDLIAGMGLNAADVPADDAARAVFNRAAGKQALRTIISRLRAGIVYCSQTLAGVITWPSVIPGQDGSSGVAFGGSGGSHWSDVASVTQNSGAAYKSTATVADSFTITLPKNFTGGVVAVCMIAPGSGVTHAMSGSAITSTNGTALVVDSPTQFPVSGTIVIRIDNEEMLVTAGLNTTSWTVVRGVNGTTAATHSVNAVVDSSMPTVDTASSPTVAGTTHRVAWSGTASGVSGAAKTPIGGQGAGAVTGGGGPPGPLAIVKRFVCTSADAAKTIIATVENFVTSDSSARVFFDSWWLESAEPPPVVMSNIQDWAFGRGIAGGENVHAQTYIPAWNTMLTEIVAEFDAWVAIADVYTPWWRKNGTLQTAMNNSTDPITVNWTANDVSFTPVIGTLMDIGGPISGPFPWPANEQVLITAVSGTAPNWSLTVSRSANGSPKVTHSVDDAMNPADWMHTDWLHLNTKGHSVFAETLYRGFLGMPMPAAYQLAQVQGVWSQYSQQWSMGVIDNGYLYTQANAFTNAVVISARQYFVPIWIARMLTVIEMGLGVTTAGTASQAKIRYGIYRSDSSRARPQRLVQDLGLAVATAVSDGSGVVGCYQDLRPGYYWLSCAGQGYYGSADWAGTADSRVTTTNGTPGTLTDSRARWLPNEWAGALVTCNGKTMTVASNTSTTLTGTAAWSGGDPGQGNSYTITAITSSNTTLVDARAPFVASAWINAIVTCNGKTMTVTSNTTTTLTGASWGGGGNPGTGFLYSLAPQTQPTVRNIAANSLLFPVLMSSAVYGAFALNGYSLNGVVGPLADVVGSSLAEVNNAAIPRMFVRVRTPMFG